MARKPKSNVEIGMDATKGLACMGLGLIAGFGTVAVGAYTLFNTLTGW